jgi:phosphodiesterase/alkaline phosphatase D-like protein
MRIYESMRRTGADFFIHSGDTIYADRPIAASQPAEAGKVWNNLVTPEVAKVAESLDEFRGLGHQQLHWLMRELAGSRAVWKIIAADMPLGPRRRALLRSALL